MIIKSIKILIGIGRVNGCTMPIILILNWVMIIMDLVYQPSWELLLQAERFQVYGQ